MNRQEEFDRLTIRHTTVWQASPTGQTGNTDSLGFGYEEKLLRPRLTKMWPCAAPVVWDLAPRPVMIQQECGEFVREAVKKKFLKRHSGHLALPPIPYLGSLGIALLHVHSHASLRVPI